MKESSTIDYYDMTPRITLAPDYEKYKEPEGLDVNLPEKLNFFSCLDDDTCVLCSEREFEFFPGKFQTRYEEE